MKYGGIIQCGILYASLFGLALWRGIYPCTTWTRKPQMYFNYASALYSVLIFLWLTESIEFVIAVVRDIEISSRTGHTPWPADWLRVMAVICPFAVLITIVVVHFQSRQHIREIREGRSVWLHERTLSILAVPAVYGLMAMEAMVQMYNLSVEQDDKGSDADLGDTKHVAVASFDTILHVGLVFQAWGLYQFGQLTTELLRQAFTHTTLVDENERMVVQRAQLSFTAVADVMWVGCGLFLLLVLIASAWTFVMWICDIPLDNREHFDRWLRQFFFSVLTASAGAIYNIHKVEQAFGHLVKNWQPLLKFLQVKMLVFFSCWQLGLFKFIVNLEIVAITGVQLKLFNAALLTWECLLCALINVFGWHSSEMWYDTYEVANTPKAPPTEQTALLGRRA